MVDGDTLVASTAFGEVTVRLIGVDASEKQKCGGKQATSAMRRLALPGEAIELATDETQGRFDKYGRMLAYVTGDDGRLLQTDLLNTGWAKVYVVGKRFERYSSFAAVQKKAKRKGRGAWTKCQKRPKA